MCVKIVRKYTLHEITHNMQIMCKICVKLHTCVWNYKICKLQHFSEINFEDDDDGPRIIPPEPNSIPAVCWVYFQKKGFALQKDSIFPAQRFTARNNILRRMILQGSSPIHPIQLSFWVRCCATSFCDGIFIFILRVGGQPLRSDWP